MTPTNFQSVRAGVVVPPSLREDAARGDAPFQPPPAQHPMSLTPSLFGLVTIDIGRAAGLFDEHVEGLPPAIRFDGDTYEPPLDAERLGSQAKAVFKLMRDEQWRTLRQIADATGYPEASVSARLRDFRKRKFGRNTVERRRVAGGTYEYRLVVQRDGWR